MFLLSGLGRYPMTVAQTSLWLQGPRRPPDGGAQASLGILKAFLSSSPTQAYWASCPSPTVQK